MYERFSLEESGESVGYPVDEASDSCGVGYHCPRLLQPGGRNVTGGGHRAVRDPGNEVLAHLVLHATHHLLHLLHPDLPPHDGGHREEPAPPGVTARQVVTGLEELRDQLTDSESLELLTLSAHQRSEPGHEEVEPGEGNQVDRQLPEVRIELAGEPEAGGHTGHGEGHQVVEVKVGRRLELEVLSADVEDRLIVNTEDAVSDFNEMVEGEARIVGLRHGVRHLLRGDDRETVGNPVRILFSDLQTLK